MDIAVETVLKEFEERAAAESEQIEQMDAATLKRHVDEFLLPIGPSTGQLINILAKEANAKTILEVGSSYGYSTIWLAEAARTTGGKVISLEISSKKQEHARAAIQRAGLAAHVNFSLGDARDSIALLKEQIDAVLLDLWKNLYIPCFDLFYPKLNPGALIVADNMLQPEFSQPEAVAYQNHVRAHPDIRSLMLHVGSGIELSIFRS
jgi:predicted O-methyltransferase YrrM